MPKITQILFDCHNTLVLSEEIAFQACVELVNQTLQAKGFSDRYTRSQFLIDFAGQNFRGMLTSLQSKYGFTLEQTKIDDPVAKEEDMNIEMLEERVQPCLGVNAELDKLAASKKYGLAVVSSSALRSVQVSVRKVGQEKYFPSQHVFSATSLPKPDPAIYLHACKALGKDPCECVAVEDSKSGVLSAVRAGIHVVGYVGSYGGENQDEMAIKLKETGGSLPTLGPLRVLWTRFSSWQSTLHDIPAFFRRKVALRAMGRVARTSLKIFCQRKPFLDDPAQVRLGVSPILQS